MPRGTQWAQSTKQFGEFCNTGVPNLGELCSNRWHMSRQIQTTWGCYDGPTQINRFACIGRRSSAVVDFRSNRILLLLALVMVALKRLGPPMSAQSVFLNEFASFNDIDCQTRTEIARIGEWQPVVLTTQTRPPSVAASAIIAQFKQQDDFSESPESILVRLAENRQPVLGSSL